MSKKWSSLIKIRDICNISIEEKRSNKLIGSSLEAALTIRLDKKNFEIVQDIDLAELCITSSVKVNVDPNVKNIEVQADKAKGKKCPICWKIVLEPCARCGS